LTTRTKLKRNKANAMLRSPPSLTTGSSSTHVSPAAIRNMHTNARSNLRKLWGAETEKKFTPKIASAASPMQVVTPLVSIHSTSKVVQQKGRNLKGTCTRAAKDRLQRGAGTKMAGRLTDGDDDEKNEEGVGDRYHGGGEGEDDLEQGRAKSGHTNRQRLEVREGGGVHAKQTREKCCINAGGTWRRAFMRPKRRTTRKVRMRRMTLMGMSTGPRATRERAMTKKSKTDQPSLQKG
jgi:hypothetical protein